ncbi:protein MCM10 homolog [Coccinella septempunctata]|uniref:protein MCM10 homolog n=1 Tax=Coccinella septempunctata TaxID=41139 RepID=UPI001D0682C7|nr:protein MCM10 homolog [Coccinella septempunctata]
MAHEDDLLACLLDVAEAELNSLNRKENGTIESSISNEVIPQNRNVQLLQDIDFLAYDNNEAKTKNDVTKTISNIEQNFSSIHEGFTDSSDDEGNRNFEEKKYSESGESIKKLINHSESSYDHGSKERITQQRNIPSKNWKTKLIAPTSIQIPERTKASSNLISFDTMFGIRVINPIISSKSLEEKMVGRKVVPIQHISTHLKSLSKNDDWVIAGVICNKGCTKTSAKGNSFMIWTISDLVGDIKTVALFLFGSAYEQFWKTQAGSVVGVLNPSILDKRDGARDEATLSIDNPQKLLILGQSKDLGMCKSTKKNGDKCTAIVNKSDCEYCVYHVKKEYQKCSRRSELQANFSGKGLIALRNKVLGKNEVFYAGKSYTAIPAKQSRKLIKKDKDRLQSLSGMTRTSSVEKFNVRKAAASFDVDSSQRLKDMDTLRKLGASTEKFEVVDNSNFKNKHSAGVSLNEAKANAAKVLSKLQIREESSIKNRKEKENDKKSCLLLETGNENKYMRKKSSGVDHKYELLQKSLDEIVQTDFIDLDVDYRKSGISFNSIKTSSSTNNFNSQKKEHKTQKEGLSDLNDYKIQNTVAEITSDNKSDFSPSLLAATKICSVKSLADDKTPLEASQKNTSEPVFSKALLTSTLPSLSSSGGMIDLSAPIRKKIHEAKLNALKYVEKNGPLKKSNPNSITGRGLKRSLDELNISGENSNKIQKFQENEHLSDRFKKMMELQSKHTDLIELRDNEEKEKYFMKQEVKERMEEKMANTYKVECKAVRCLDCKYTNFSASEKCKAEKHRLVYRKAMKRFFKCGNCGNRVACLDIIPLYPCKNCGDGKWERTTMMKEKTITNSVALSIRGGEQTFVNSVVSDANINLLVPEES